MLSGTSLTACWQVRIAKPMAGRRAAGPDGYRGRTAGTWYAANTGHGQGRPCRGTCARRQAACHRASRPCQAGPVPGTPDPPFWRKSPSAGLSPVAAQNGAFIVPSAVRTARRARRGCCDQLEGAADGGEGGAGICPGGVLVIQHHDPAADAPQRPRCGATAPRRSSSSCATTRWSAPAMGGRCWSAPRGSPSPRPMLPPGCPSAARPPPPRWPTGSGRVPAENRYLRLVFASEPVERLAALRDRFAAAF